MRSVRRFLKKQDDYGHPVTINYKGEDKYQTAWGAFLTILQKIFILVVAVFGLVDLFAFKDPNITQFSIFDKRTDDVEFNFGEMHGGFYFGFFNPTSFSYSAFERYLDVSILQVEIDEGEIFPTDIEISVDQFTQENFPAQFKNQFFTVAFLQYGPIYSSKDLDKLVLKNTKVAVKSKLINIIISQCNEAKVALGCASETERAEFLEQHSLSFFRNQNFIDYEKFDGLPLEQIPYDMFVIKLSETEYVLKELTMIET